MNAWFFTMMHAFKRKIQEHHSVEFVQECRDVEEGHKSWSSTLGIDNQEAKCQPVENGNVDEFRKLLKSVKNKDMKGIQNRHRTHANGFFHLADNKFGTIEWI